MSGSNKNDGPLGQIIASVVIALLVGGSAPWWWQALFAGEDTPNPQPPEQIAPTPEPTASPTPSPQPEPVEPRLTSISVAYRGDYFGCSLPVSISVAGQAFYPDAAIYQISNVEVGQQQYQVGGQINCPTVGSCQVSGQGTIDVVPNGVYYMVWQNTGVGQCSAILQANI